VRCMKNENDQVLSEDAEIKERWQIYFSKPLNGEVMENVRSRERECSERRLDPQLCGHMSKDKIKEALKKMANGKVEGPDQIPVEV